MIVSVEDFLRRRTKIALIRSEEDLAADPGMAEVSRFFGVTEPSDVRR
jgi:glycerol-3-phosphate dehydrogenase